MSWDLYFHLDVESGHDNHHEAGYTVDRSYLLVLNPQRNSPQAYLRCFVKSNFVGGEGPVFTNIDITLFGSIVFRVPVAGTYMLTAVDESTWTDGSVSVYRWTND